MERLGDIIIPPVFQRHDLVHLTVPRGNEQHRASRDIADLPAPVITVIAGQIHIKQNQLRSYPFKFLQHLMEILDLYHIIPVLCNR
ncbi:hypothetical protein D3C79_888300 [compost metagenome]